MRFRNPLIGPEAIVVAIDIRSSSRMLDDLVIHSRLDPFVDLLTAMKHQIAESTISLRCAPYKFTGDGWIVLFDTSTEGTALYDFAVGLSACYRTKSKGLLEHLSVPPPSHGLTFGVDSGPILKTTIFQRPEYIGQPIVIACRLQAASKKSPTPAYRALVSAAVFDRYLSAIPGVESREESVRLGTAEDGKDFPCKSICLL